MGRSQFEKQYLEILEEELVTAIGCTEPISVAFAAAKAKKILKTMPTRIRILACGGLIKNIRSAIVPNTKDLAGIEASILSGLVAGDSDLGLEVLKNLNEADRHQIKALLDQDMIEVGLLETDESLHFILTLENDEESVRIEIKGTHTNIIRIDYNEQTIYETKEDLTRYLSVLTDRSTLRFDSIVEFAKTVSVDALDRVFRRAIEQNMRIAEEGVEKDYCLSIGKTILKHDKTMFGAIKAYTAAASEARMCGSMLPVVTNSGSGNQGISSIVPIVVFARRKNIEHERMLRAVAISSLLTIYQKTYIGRLSAFCGAISATSSCSAAFTFLAGGTLEQMKMSLTNALAGSAGILCDGAKASCGFKISTGLDTAIQGHLLALENKTYRAGCGFIKDDIDSTIKAIGEIATEGMKETDRVIRSMMLK
jgi:L-cysteine desulfidase